MTQYQSDKLRFISFVCILLVLYIHSVFHFKETEVESMSLCYYLQEVISGMLGRLAVPMFFAISGSLFFKGTEDSIKVVYQKQRRRVKTLAIPYILAALFPPIVYLILKFSGLLDFMLSKSLHYLSDPWWLLLCRIFVFNLPDNIPFAGQLWFLRDLIVVVCFTPLLWRLKQTKFGMEILLIFSFILLMFDLKYLPLKAFFWFCFGVKYLTKLKRGLWAYIGIVIFFVASLFQIAFPHDGWKYVDIPIVAIGVLSIWFLYDKLIPPTFSLSSHQMLNLLCQGTFFIYLYHIPLTIVVGQSIVHVLHRSSMIFAFSYLVTPWITMACLVMIALLLQKFFPRFYSVLVGGRVFNRSFISQNNP